MLLYILLSDSIRASITNDPTLYSSVITVFQQQPIGHCSATASILLLLLKLSADFIEAPLFTNSLVFVFRMDM